MVTEWLTMVNYWLIDRDEWLMVDGSADGDFYPLVTRQ